MSDRTPLPSALSIEARDSFLSRYDGETRKLYTADLRVFYAWCAERDLDPIAVRRHDLELFSDWMITVRGNRAVLARRRLHALKSFYGLAHADYLIDRDPTRMLRLPRLERDPSRLAWLDRFQVGDLLHEAEKTGPDHHALVALMAMAGLRVSAACRCSLEQIAPDVHGIPTIRVLEKGNRIHTAPIPPELRVIIEAARDGRTEGTIVRRRNGLPQDRNGAYAWVRSLARKAGLPGEREPALHPPRRDHPRDRLRRIDGGRTRLRRPRRHPRHSGIPPDTGRPRHARSVHGRRGPPPRWHNPATPEPPALVAVVCARRRIAPSRSKRWRGRFCRVTEALSVFEIRGASRCGREIATHRATGLTRHIERWKSSDPGPLELVTDAGVDLRRRQTRVHHQLLHNPDVRAGIDQVRTE